MTTLQDLDIDPLLARLEQGVTAWLDYHGDAQKVIVGIHTGGWWLAQHLHRKLAPELPLGSLGISFYRDDFARKGLNPQVQASDLACGVEDQHVLLVDDVLYSGRTVRAAMNELFDFGRPASVSLAVLVERASGRELPVTAQIVGTRMDLLANQQVKLAGPDPMTLSLEQRA